jgi:hypothetical protein
VLWSVGTRRTRRRVAVAGALITTADCYEYEHRRRHNTSQPKVAQSLLQLDGGGGSSGVQTRTRLLRSINANGAVQQ